MPVYEYVCTSCGRTTEVMHGIHADGPSRCDECGGGMRKLLSAPAIVFKGSGWAKKDARGAGSGGSRSSGASKRSSTDEAPAAASTTSAASGHDD